MSPTSDNPTPDDITDLIDDHVMGLRTDTESLLIEALLARDPALAARAGALRDQLLPLDLSARAQPVPDDLARRIRAALPLRPAQPAPTAANLTTPPRRSRLALLAAAIAGLGIGIGVQSLQPVPQPAVVAVLVDDAGVPQAVIDDFGNDTATVRFVADITVPADRSLQVWTLPSAEMGPMSLGTLDRTMAARLRFQNLPDPAAAQLYEVTLEPLGGSPTGRPTGPIIGKGFAAPQA